MSEPKERGTTAATWPLTDEGQELLNRVLEDVRREILERAQLAAEDLYADGDVPKRLIGEHAIFNGFLDVAWEGLS